jgi:SNF family Na+-dependent transporter
MMQFHLKFVTFPNNFPDIWEIFQKNWEFFLFFTTLTPWVSLVVVIVVIVAEDLRRKNESVSSNIYHASEMS